MEKGPKKFSKTESAKGNKQLAAIARRLIKIHEHLGQQVPEDVRVIAEEKE